MIMGFLAGAVWGLIPGILKARFGVNEIITTLMLNYIAFYWVAFWVFGSWSERGFQLTPPDFAAGRGVEADGEELAAVARGQVHAAAGNDW
jgi:ABC-type uncharacterized transport system permease subunit